MDYWCYFMKLGFVDGLITMYCVSAHRLTQAYQRKENEGIATNPCTSRYVSGIGPNTEICNNGRARQDIDVDYCFIERCNKARAKGTIDMVESNVATK
jgi:hypothetical protein